MLFCYVGRCGIKLVYLWKIHVWIVYNFANTMKTDGGEIEISYNTDGVEINIMPYKYIY